jgi:hypothetical protein
MRVALRRHRFDSVPRTPFYLWKAIRRTRTNDSLLFPDPGHAISNGIAGKPYGARSKERPHGTHFLQSLIFSLMAGNRALPLRSHRTPAAHVAFFLRIFNASSNGLALRNEA